MRQVFYKRKGSESHIEIQNFMPSNASKVKKSASLRLIPVYVQISV
jgi:hypothetical protein